MNDKPEDPDDDRSGESQNPFKGTPFEQLFSGPMAGLFAGQMPGSAQMPDLQALMRQMQSLMQPYDGPLNWPAAIDIARQQVAQTPDPTPSAGQVSAVDDAVRLADLWLDTVTDFATGVTSTSAWARAEWVTETVDVWKVLVEPMAAHTTGLLGKTMGELGGEGMPPGMGGPLVGMVEKMIGGMLASQIGSGIGALAGEVLSASDIGLPLGPAGHAALVPANIAEFARDLDVPAADVVLYVALREAAHQRLFAHVPWLRDHLTEAVAAYASGVDVNLSAITDRLQSFDPSDMASMTEAMEGGLFDVEPSPAQRAALEKLEITLALVEGWVDEVVAQATEERMPNAAKLAEAMRRRRATGGPAERTFATLVGLELRPRRLRDAATLWGSLRTRQGSEGRDGVWMHPGLLPTAADLDDPLGFREDAVSSDDLDNIDSLGDDFDAELLAFLDGPKTAKDAGDEAGEQKGEEKGEEKGEASDGEPEA